MATVSSSDADSSDMDRLCTAVSQDCAVVDAAGPGSTAAASLEQPQQEQHVMQYDRFGLPLTLLDWRRAGRDLDGTARYLWDPLEPFFERSGYVLFVANPPEVRKYGLRPRNLDEIRAPDMFHEVYTGENRPKLVQVDHTSNKCCPATRRRDGAHVMIQLVCKRGQGYRELEVLRRFSRPEVVTHPDNHVIPLLDELELQDMVFVVVPLLCENVVSPWFYDVNEVLDAMSQTFRGLAFMHEHRTAHLDLGPDDILINYGGNAGRTEFTKAFLESSPFRSLLSGPCIYTFIDFEFSAKFPYFFKPEDCVVRGVGLLKAGRMIDLQKYGKDLPPQWTKADPYCPFKSNVFQIGVHWREYLWDMRELLPELAQILDDMAEQDPTARLTMAEASNRLEDMRTSLNHDMLFAKAWDYCPDKRNLSSSERRRMLAD